MKRADGSLVPRPSDEEIVAGCIAHGSVRAYAEELGVSRRAIQSLIERHGLRDLIRRGRWDKRGGMPPYMDPFKQKARWAVRAALEKGALVRDCCEVCGDPSTEAHHEDYSRPLDVRWLCRDHHLAIHRRPLVHGTHVAYNYHKCKCDVCRRFKADYRSERRSRARAALSRQGGACARP